MKFGHTSDSFWVHEAAIRQMMYERGLHRDFVESFIENMTEKVPGHNVRGIKIDDLLEGTFSIYFNAWCAATGRKDGTKCYPEGFAPRRS